ncbi:hypothetical protein V8017_02885 [Stenotrophomonas rhizophila]
MTRAPSAPHWLALGGTRWSAVLVGMAIYIVVIGALSFLLDP